MEKVRRGFTEGQVFEILRQFMVKEVHGSDFSMGQSVNQTVDVARKWWDKHKAKFVLDMLRK